MFFRPLANDVTAVVLTTGEPTTQDAIDSVRRQTMPVQDIVVVRGVRPFHNAINEGASRVTTRFFIQVDADMILDRHCVATLRNAMRPSVGIAVGHLRDEMMKRVVGVKVFRTACFEADRFRDSIATDTDFDNDIARAGWQTVYVGRRGGTWATFGQHQPNYTLRYTYLKHLMMGARYHHRRNLRGLRWHLGQLEQAEHPAALAAQIALARGFFREMTADALGYFLGDDEFMRLSPFLCAAKCDNVPTRRDLVSGLSSDLFLSKENWRELFDRSWRTGTTLFNNNDVETFAHCMRMLNTRDDQSSAWIQKMGLCQGLLSSDGGNIIEANWRRLTDANAGLKSLPDCADIDSANNNSTLDGILDYAEAIGLRRFVVMSPFLAEYARSVGGGYRRTPAGPIGVTEVKGRTRVELPFRLFGHVICTEPPHLAGLLWCFDTIKAGYLYAHAPASFGFYRVLLLWQLARNLLERCRWLPASTQTGAPSADVFSGVTER